MRKLCRALLLAASFLAAPDRPAHAVPHEPSNAAHLMQRQVSIHWQGVSMRDACCRLAATQGLTIFLDRRIDAQRTINLQVREQMLQQVIAQITAQAGAELVLLPSLCYIGPRETIEELPTLMEIAREQTQAMPPAFGRKLRRKQSLHWQRLDTPEHILQSLLQPLELQVDLEQLPHDLWDEGALPEAAVGEQLTILLAGFDLTWRWDQGRNAIQLVPIERPVRLARSYTWRGVTAARLQQVAAQMPTAKVQFANGKVLLDGRVEDHQKLLSILSDLPQSQRPIRRSLRAEPTRKLYSLRFEGQPVGDVLRELARQLELELRVDEAALGNARPSLNERISLEVSQVGLEALLEEIGQAAGLRITTKGGALHVEPH